MQSLWLLLTLRRRASSSHIVNDVLHLGSGSVGRGINTRREYVVHGINRKPSTENLLRSHDIPAVDVRNSGSIAHIVEDSGHVDVACAVLRQGSLHPVFTNFGFRNATISYVQL
nr:hypothetical protein CFP56_75357 [Quercus suber]